MTAWNVSQADVLAAARVGRLFVQWVPLLGVEGVEVMADAARLDGVRVPVTSATAEAIARDWGCELPTPATCDLRHRHAAEVGILTGAPPTQDYRTMATLEAVAGYNRALDALGVPPAVELEAPPVVVSDCGKVWVMTAELKRRRAAGERTLACNYGFFTPAARVPRGAVGPKPSATGLWNVWQEPGYRHDAAHWDYSQTLQLVRVAPGAVQPSHDGVTSWRVGGGEPLPPPVAPPVAVPAADLSGLGVAVGAALLVAAVELGGRLRA